MIDTKKTYEKLIGLEFSSRQAEGLTEILKDQSTDALETRLTVIETKLNMLLIGLPILIVGCTTMLGWIISNIKK